MVSCSAVSSTTKSPSTNSCRQFSVTILLHGTYRTHPKRSFRRMVAGAVLAVLIVVARNHLHQERLVPIGCTHMLLATHLPRSVLNCASYPLKLWGNYSRPAKAVCRAMCAGSDTTFTLRSVCFGAWVVQITGPQIQTRPCQNIYRGRDFGRGNAPCCGPSEEGRRCVDL